MSDAASGTGGVHWWNRLPGSFRQRRESLSDPKPGHRSGLTPPSQRRPDENSHGKLFLDVLASDHLEGYLDKKEGTGLHLWKRRWFVLREGCLYFHKDQSAAEAGGRGKVFLVHSVVIERGLLGMPHNLRMVVTNEEDAAMALAFPSEHTLLTWHRALTGGVSTQPCSPSPQSWGEQWPSSPQAPHADAPPAERHFGFSAHGAAASGLEAGPDHPPPAGRPSLGADGDAARRDARGAAAAVLSEAALARHRAQARPDLRRPAAPPRAPRPALRRPADAPGLPGSAPKERACMAPPGRGCPRGRGGAR